MSTLNIQSGDLVIISLPACYVRDQFPLYTRLTRNGNIDMDQESGNFSAVAGALVLEVRARRGRWPCVKVTVSGCVGWLSVLLMKLEPR